MLDAPSHLNVPAQFDLRRPSAARISNCLLGGDTNWALDREFARRAQKLFPLLADVTMANHLFLVRVVRYLARSGIRQFIDIGGGTPTPENTHRVADKVVPDCRVVYVESDPIAVAHAEIQLDQDGDPRRHAVVCADPSQPEELWERSCATQIIDPNEPVALLMIAVTDDFQIWRCGGDLGANAVTRYRRRLPVGSHLAISHITKDGTPGALVDQLCALTKLYNGPRKDELTWRSRTETASLFGDFEMVHPGIVWTTAWRPDEQAVLAEPNQSMMFAGVGRKV